MKLVSGLLDLLFPPKCMFCRKVLPYGKHGACEKCLEELRYQNLQKRGDYFLRCCAPLSYEGTVREAFIRYKFGGQSGYATEFARIMAKCIRDNLDGQYDMITWVPVSGQRRKERGYDQAMLLAMAVALELGDVAVETLEKPMDNAAQSGLQGAEARQKNVKGAYTVVDRDLVEGKRILLIDDVITTGATLDEASKTLLKNGAQAVLCAALAMTPHD